MRIMETQSGKPVEGLEKTLNVEVIFGASTTPLQLRAALWTARGVPCRPCADESGQL